MSASSVIPVQDGLPKGWAPPGLKPAGPAAAGLDPLQLETAFDVVAQEVRTGSLPGAVAVVVHKGLMAGYRAWGWAQVAPDRRPMALDTLFDVASLTKVIATLPAILQLNEQGAFRLDDLLSRFFPGFTGEGREEIRIRHLLTHTAGFQPFIPLEREGGTREQYIERILSAPLASTPGSAVIYSDVGFILLGELVRKVSGKPLDLFFRERIAQPLGLAHATFNPAEEVRPVCAATEYREYLGRHQCGEVHDERATFLEGVAGHAGLFATASEVAAYGQAWLTGLTPYGGALLSKATIAAATRDWTPQTPGDARALGWMALRPHATLMSCGDLFTPGSFGHTGFTGTSLWVDPARQLVVALLTNRVHLGRENTSETIIRLRPRFHNAVAAAIR